MTKRALLPALRHFGYAAGWKKFEPMWDWVIRTKRVTHMLPVLERLLAALDRKPSVNRTIRAGTLSPLKKGFDRVVALQL